MLQERRSQAARLLQTQGMTRLDVLNYISHGITKVPSGPESPSGTGGKSKTFSSLPKEAKDGYFVFYEDDDTKENRAEYARIYWEGENE